MTLKSACAALALCLSMLAGAPAPAAAQDGASGADVPLSEQQGRNPLDPVQQDDPSVEAAKPDWMKKAKDNDPALRDGVPLEEPHLTPREVREWASNAVADLLNFSFRDFNERQGSFAKYFTDRGHKHYKAYLDQARMEEVINNYRYNVTGVVVNVPYIAEEKSVGGFYRWLVEVPVMMSYLEETQEAMDAEQPPLTDDLLVTIEIARVPRPELTDEEHANQSMMDSMNVAIHSWQVKQRKRR